MSPHAVRLLLMIITLLLTGCGSGGGESPVRYYLITPATDVGQAADNHLTVEVTVLEIPQYLERFQIASRRDDNQLVFATSHQWAENLRKNLLRTLAQNLTLLLGTPDVGTPANRSASDPDVRVRVFIEQFERFPDGHVHLSARWQLVDGTSQQTIATRVGQYKSPGAIASKDFAGTVAAMGELFTALCRDIATEIEGAGG